MPGSGADRRSTPGDRRGGGGQRRREERPAALALAALEVPVRVLTAYWPGASWSPFMAMHIEQPASRQSAPAARKISWSPSRSASRFTSSEPGTTIIRTPSATFRPLHRRGGEPQVADPPVGARADEDDVDLLAEDRLAGREVHVGERLLEATPPLVVARPSAGSGTVRGDRHAHARVRAVGDHRLERRGVDRDRPVERRARVGRERAPALHGARPKRRPAGACGGRRGTRTSCRRGR